MWLYLRFTLSYRDVEDLLAERGLDISYETVRCWVLKLDDNRRENGVGVRDFSHRLSLPAPSPPSHLVTLTRPGRAIPLADVEVPSPAAWPSDLPEHTS